ncbi:MAG: ribosomal protein S18-alanine N-acetyltransferase [Thermoleophilia bacterium]|nr:ribosomal protein S18-alanine N-acetyltransferase [Thermoleophilia bacterium]
MNETVEKPAPEPSALRLRQLTYADLPVVVSIERRSFVSPWSPGMFVLEMSKGSTISLVAVQEGDDRLVAYAVFSRYDAAWHLMNVAVAPEHRRHGIASALINGALARIEPDAPVTLEVRPSNQSAIALYGTFGFRNFGHRKRYYANGEDAMIMWRGDPALAGVPAEAAAGS